MDEIDKILAGDSNLDSFRVNIIFDKREYPRDSPALYGMLIKTLYNHIDELKSENEKRNKLPQSA